MSPVQVISRQTKPESTSLFWEGAAPPSKDSCPSCRHLWDVLHNWRPELEGWLNYLSRLRLTGRSETFEVPVDYTLSGVAGTVLVRYADWGIEPFAVRPFVLVSIVDADAQVGTLINIADVVASTEEGFAVRVVQEAGFIGTSNASGVVTWTYQTPFEAGVSPFITLTPVSATQAQSPIAGLTAQSTATQAEAWVVNAQNTNPLSGIDVNMRAIGAPDSTRQMFLDILAVGGL